MTVVNTSDIGGVILAHEGQRIALRPTTEAELLAAEAARAAARARLLDNLRQPPSDAALAASAQELMELMELDEPEARELFPEKFPR